jgi:hypothetical protein
MIWTGHTGSKGEIRKAYKISVEEFQGKEPVGRFWRIWVVNSKMGLGEVGCKDMNCIGLVYYTAHWRAVANTAVDVAITQVIIWHQFSPS